MSERLFDFLKDEKYKLMLDFSREIIEKKEIPALSERYLNLDQRQFFELCHEHELDGVVASRVLEFGLPLCEEWQNEYESQKKQLEALSQKAKDTCDLMAQNGIPMVILKNGGIMISMVNDPVRCPMEDIDSLVRKSDFLKAHDILQKNGFDFNFRSVYEKEVLDEAYRDGSTEYHIQLPDNRAMWFELAWRAIAGRWIRPDLEPDTDELIERSFVQEGTNVHILSPEDNLLQVCIHTAKHSYVRAPGLRLHMDVDRIVAHSKIDWQAFLEKVKKTHVCRSTYLSLYIPSVLFGTKIPQAILNELKPRNVESLMNMLAKAGLPHPHGPKFGKLSFLFFQTALYDSKADMFHVLYPGKEWINERYNCRNGLDRMRAVCHRGFDLVGIRRKKAK